MSNKTQEAPRPVLQAPLYGRWPLAAALVLAPLLFALSSAFNAVAISSGGNDGDTGTDQISLLQEHPTLVLWATQAALLGCLLIVPAVLAAGQLAAARSRILGLADGWLMGLGFIAAFGVDASMFLQFAVVAQGKGLDAFAAAIDTVQGGASGGWVFNLFVVGHLLGTTLLGAALWRSRIVPVWAACLVIAWPVFHIIGLSLGIEWFEVTGALCIAVGFSQVARKVLGR